MTWTDPTTRSTGDLITAAIWNQDVVDNGHFLHDRAAVRFYSPNGRSSTFASAGYHSAARLSGGNNVYFEFDIPDDFDSLTRIEIAAIPTATG